ncbi:MAG: BREX-1 system adenine-specific DNA-methyltransferase PglX, partial [Clostridia bacterium]|nr:BREX-1 system adenine-specific DNA-methyltransferase PglX [Clostridia bacterium]
MNKTAIKNFAIWARRKLIGDITYKAGLYGVTEQGVAQAEQPAQGIQIIPLGRAGQTQIEGSDIALRAAFVAAIAQKARETDYKTAFQTVVEQIAYTWFNRLIAIRFMEVNGYLPSGVRVLSSENPAKLEPDFVTTPFDAELSFTDKERERVLKLKDANRLDELFRMLFIKQCNALGEVLPGLFEKVEDYTELLLTLSFTDKDGVVYHLTHDIAQDDFDVTKGGQVEIIGWMYQYYNTEPKDEVFALLKKNVKITKERIPAATQLFTPDWIVRYMVENSLGRLWVEGRPNDELKSGWKYYLEEAGQEPAVQARLKEIRAQYGKMQPEDIRCIDPCMGSGHILVCLFDVLMQIYETRGYTRRDAVRRIIGNNLYGLDIDNRAAQLAYFSVMMKARQYDSRFLSRKLDNGKPDIHKPNVYAIRQSNDLDKDMVNYFTGGDKKLKGYMDALIHDMQDAREYGSIITVSQVDFDALYNRFDALWDEMSLYKTMLMDELLPFVRVAEALAQKYDVVVTNPPYMGSSGMGDDLSKFVKNHYPDSKSDLFAVFIERCGEMTKKNGYQAMITQHAWMFLSSFEKLRGKLMARDTVNMAHLGARAFEEIGGEVVQTASFVMRNGREKGYKGTYCRLIEPASQQGKEDMFLAGDNRYVACQDNFAKIPGGPVAYWANKAIISAFEKKISIHSIARPRLGFATGDNDRFMRFWFEPSHERIGYGFCDRNAAQTGGRKWFPTNKGGSYRKWYGNFDLVVNWENDGYEIRNFRDDTGYLRSRPQNLDECFCDGVTWTVICNHSSFRYSPKGMLYNNKGPILGKRDDEINYLVLGYLNTCVAEYILQILSPTLGFEAGYISNLPYVSQQTLKNYEVLLVKECISLSRS